MQLMSFLHGLCQIWMGKPKAFFNFALKNNSDFLVLNILVMVNHQANLLMKYLKMDTRYKSAYKTCC